MYVGNCDGTSNNNAAIIGAIVGVDCTVIIIMVITNIMVWIYCFRRRQHTGMYMVCESVKCFTKNLQKFYTQNLVFHYIHTPPCDWQKITY